MSMHTTVSYGYDMGDKVKKYNDIYNACMEVGVKPPQEICDYIAEIEEKGEMDEKNNTLYMNLSKDDAAVKKYCSDGAEGFLVEVSKIPKDVKYIRFQNNW